MVALTVFPTIFDTVLLPELATYTVPLEATATPCGLAPTVIVAVIVFPTIFDTALLE